jgi:hypothetical protein
MYLFIIKLFFVICNYKIQSTIFIPKAYSSVHESSPEHVPPNASPAPCVPAPAKLTLAIINELHADQDVPLYSSVHDTASFTD